MEQRRVIITIGLSVVIILGWFWLFPPTPQAPPPAPSTPQTPATAAAPPTPGTPGQPGAPSTSAAQRPPEERVTVVREGLYRAVFTTWGAAPVELTLLNPQYKEQVPVPKADYLKSLPPGTPPVRVSEDDPNWKYELQQINLVRPNAGGLPLQITFADTSISLPPDAAWTLVSKTDEELVYAVDVGPEGKVHVEKRWRLPRAGYSLGVTVTVENRGQTQVAEHLKVLVPTWQDPLIRPSAFSFGKRYNLSYGSCYVNGKLRNKTHDELMSPPSSGWGCGGGGQQQAPAEPGVSEGGDVRWIGAGEQFFLVAAAFGPEAQGVERRCGVHADAAGRILADATFAERRLGPGQKTTYEMAVFAGPKLLHDLDAVTVGGGDPKLGVAVDYTLEFVARPMLWVLKQIQRVVVNWGVAIIIITILLKIVTWYPTARSMKSMRGMAALKPKMDAIREKFKDDKNRQNQETMALYKQHGINPLGGCLPTLIQMPIYIAFYSMLSNAVELYRASFIPGLMPDMTASFWPLAVLTGVLMFVQQKISPQTPDSQQQKMMMYMMPLMFAAFTIFLPSGLTLYIFTNTLLTMGQQWWFNRTHPLPAMAVASSKASGKPNKPRGDK